MLLNSSNNKGWAILMDKRERFKTSLCLYMNYLVHGMGIVILAQSMFELGQKWNVGNAGVSMVISSLGIGRLLVLYVSGNLSDKFGRRLFINLGIITYVFFFVGILLSRNIVEAYFFGILGGMANSFLDSGTYPALMELYPTKQASANIMIKAFASIGELVLPILVALFSSIQVWYGWSFVLCAVILLVNFFGLKKVKFPAVNKVAETDEPNSSTVSVAKGNTYTRIFLGVVLTIFGYASMATFYLISQWMTEYGRAVINLNMTHARLLVSLYSIGSIIGVLITVLLVERLIKPIWFMVFDTIASLLILFAISAIPTFSVATVGSFLIGITAAGGVMQIGLTEMGKLFPAEKGKITGIYYTASGLASFTIPVITGIISKNSVHNILWFDVIIALVGVFCSLTLLIVTKLNFKPQQKSVTEE